ncbi:MAG: hypothetical protein ABUL77_01170 [Bacteroidota bacterium]
MVRRSTGVSAGGRRARAIPVVSRLTVRPSWSAPLNRPVPVGEALRASREALGDIQRQLDALLEAVRRPAGRPAPDAADRLRQATARAGAALSLLARG